MIYKKIGALLLLCFQLAVACPQGIERKVFSVAGENVLLDNYQVSYTIGEMISGNAVYGNKQVTQGFQQPVNLIISQFVQHETGVRLHCYPNPARDVFFITIKNGQAIKNYHARVYNSAGALVQDRTVHEANRLKLDLQRLSEGAYHVRVFNKNTNLQIGSSKIIKTR